jgi:hypothetical protein
LQPQHSSWLANSTDELLEYERYIRDFERPSNLGNDGNHSVTVWDRQDFSSIGSVLSERNHYLAPDPFFKAFYQDFVGNGRSVSFALQAMCIVMAGTTYDGPFPQLDASHTV